MKDFTSLADLAQHLMSGPIIEAEGVHDGLKQAAELLEREAKAEFGVYQSAVGPFPAWAELAAATKQDRTSKGFSEDEPLLRSGGLRDSITHEVGKLEASIGSDDPVMLWQELGTSTIPPRPVLGTALMRNIEAVQGLIGKFAAQGIAAGGPIGGGRYDVD